MGQKRRPPFVAGLKRSSDERRRGDSAEMGFASGMGLMATCRIKPGSRRARVQNDRTRHENRTGNSAAARELATSLSSGW
jgi:hypothetical protein